MQTLTPKTKILEKVFSLVGNPCIVIHYWPQAMKIVINARHRSPMELRGDSDLITEIMEFLEQYGYQLVGMNSTVSYSWYEYRLPQEFIRAVEEINKIYNYPCVTLRDACIVWASHGKWNIVEKGLGNVVVKFSDLMKTTDAYGNVCYDALITLASKIRW